jgi:hypothetical protein
VECHHWDSQSAGSIASVSLVTACPANDSSSVDLHTQASLHIGEDKAQELLGSGRTQLPPVEGEIEDQPFLIGELRGHLKRRLDAIRVEPPDPGRNTPAQRCGTSIAKSCQRQPALRTQGARVSISS